MTIFLDIYSLVIDNFNVILDLRSQTKGDICNKTVDMLNNFFAIEHKA